MNRADVDRLDARITAVSNELNAKIDYVTRLARSRPGRLECTHTPHNPTVHYGIGHLEWMRQRLIHVRGEDGQVDYMEKLKAIIDKMKEN